MKKALWHRGRVTKQLVVAGFIMAAASAWAGINDGLVAFYPFDGNAKDATGNGNNGTVYGATLGTNRFNQGDASYNFDGNGDYMEVPHSSLFNINTNDFSLSLWLKYEQQPAPFYYSAICIKSSNAEYPYEGFTLFVDFPDNSCTFRIDGREPLLCHTNDLHNNTWRYLVCVKQSNQLKIYIDGLFDSSRTINYANVDNLAPIIFGANHINHNSQNYTGAMDDIRLYNRALSLAEIHNLYLENTMALAITTRIAWVTYDASAMPLAGTETGAVGHLCVSNAANGEIRSFAAAPSWQSPQIPLAVGPNTISAYATNAYGNMTNASVTITRGGIGTGAPFVDITNVVPPVLSYDVTSYAIGITNNMQVVGTRRWANALTSANGALVNNQATIPLGVGANPITVTGTNALNVSASDTITITRGGNGT
ncbi:MAG: LamG domain-containing protein, partial [bacterium]|nr:LamG domain-containing protein [bacterium]